MAFFDRTIPPGGEGKITLRINTRGYDGEIRKTARVYTNDPLKSIQTLTIRALVKAPITVSPGHVYLKVATGQVVTRTVRVTAGGNKPLKLEPGDFSLSISRKVRYKVEEVEAGREFKVHFTSMPNNVGIYLGFLKLKTNYPERPDITIRIKAQILASG